MNTALQSTFRRKNSRQKNFQPDTCQISLNRKFLESWGRVTVPKRMNFRENSRRPLTPPPSYWKIILQFFFQTALNKAEYKGTKSTIQFFLLKMTPPPPVWNFSVCFHPAISYVIRCVRFLWIFNYKYFSNDASNDAWSMIKNQSIGVISQLLLGWTEKNIPRLENAVPSDDLIWSHNLIISDWGSLCNG